MEDMQIAVTLFSLGKSYTIMCQSLYEKQAKRSKPCPAVVVLITLRYSEQMRRVV